ncbi:MAG TPA: hypothetical protein VJS20_03590 [Gemmatimonadales bacterium]|nr:hypothetical protein [Gemmatimonadales bacterium]
MLIRGLSGPVCVDSRRPLATAGGLFRGWAQWAHRSPNTDVIAWQDGHSSFRKARQEAHWTAAASIDASQKTQFMRAEFRP